MGQFSLVTELHLGTDDQNSANRKKFLFRIDR